MQPQVISVSEFLSIINETLGFAYPQVVIEGEVSSFKVNQGKFVFFDLKDESGLLSCFMMLAQLKLPLEDGMKVRVTGSPKVTKFSKFSLTVRAIELAGEGELRRAMELLKQKLKDEGLFDPTRKRSLPPIPKRIGLITSGASAAYGDFIKILGARWGGLEILLADVSVQGQQAPDQIVGAIEYFNQLTPPVDVLVLIRGGGSLEDLMAFSVEPVARAVATSRTPIIVGVGHEQDVSLADYVADLRAATPTDAARLIVPDRRDVLSHITHLSARSQARLTATLSDYRRRTDLGLTRLEAVLRLPREHVAAQEAKLTQAFRHLRTTTQTITVTATSQQARINTQFNHVLKSHRQHILSLRRLLSGFDAQATLNRGYAIVRDSQDNLIRDAKSLPPSAIISTQLAKGRLQSQVLDSPVVEKKTSSPHKP